MIDTPEDATRVVASSGACANVQSLLANADRMVAFIDVVLDTCTITEVPQ